MTSPPIIALFFEIDCTCFTYMFLIMYIVIFVQSDDIQRHISCLTAWRLTAAPLPADEALSLATKLRDHYMRCLKLGLVTATITEFCAPDAYGILAAHHYFYAGNHLFD